MLLFHISHKIISIYGQREANAIARLILEKVLHLSVVEALTMDYEELSNSQKQIITSITTRLEQGEPIQYILGEADFCGISLKVTPATLIPRPETEQLVKMVCEENSKDKQLRVIDLGTGSGCIALAIKNNCPKWKIDAIDISKETIKVAKANAIDNKLNVSFAIDDILQMRRVCDYDIVVSNPPYVMESEKLTMANHVLNYEPEMALFVPDDDALKYYEAIAMWTKSTGAKVYLEINEALSEQVARLFKKSQIIKDIYNKPRFVVGY